MNLQSQAGKHAIVGNRPAPDFFEGALLGNGGMGAVVTTRPDAVVVRFGHNDVWDIRIEERHREELGTFDSVFAKLKQIPETCKSLDEDPWYREYVKMACENYSFPYPRPMPCGSLLLGFDRRKAELLGHRLDIADGTCRVYFRAGEADAALRLFVDPRDDVLWATWEAPPNSGVAAPFDRVRLIPDPETPPELPVYAASSDDAAKQLSFRQRLPRSIEAPDPRDRAFRLTARVGGGAAFAAGGRPLEAAIGAGQDFVLSVRLDSGLAADAPDAAAPIAATTTDARDAAFIAASSDWEAYWSRSAVELEDELLERTWYRNLYFFHCAVKPEATCPGLFANWSYGRIGADWHGDYHMNYNTQQPFWAAFSSNHVDKHLAYANMVDHVLPVSRRWAREYYGLRGAYFPHSAYPVEMTMMPYPVPHWGWEVCETPWTVQSLWWHYVYTMDRTFLADRAFPAMKEAVLFMVDYMTRPEAHGEAWGDGKYHVFPTVVPELYELTPGFRKNYDCIVDLALTKFLFRAYLEACEALGFADDSAEAAIGAEVRAVLDRFPAYPTAESARGTVFVSVPGEDPEVVYNVPNGIVTVFPGEDHGLHSSPEEYRIALDSYRNHRNEGGNELVFYHLAGARLGALDLERFKRQIEYCLLPNGTCTDRLLESGGRYSDTTDYDYMSRMGIWFENFALPAVINECLLQSYNGVLRLFPNWPAEKKAKFRTMRARGAFLVSAAFEDGTAKEVEVFSEAGSALRMYNPWGMEAAVCLLPDGNEAPLTGTLFELPTESGQTLRFFRRA
ncbi:glycoside hydrolase N-terminal domain-containing protein [Paenibacillus sp.]|uniref:glycosyl hydrolase family 95 catalytic domain-containing protein n=1 Tax=Paenibacillus sp. TaxID=58172 RepID=UPI002810D310|nr:glycoside hydrolase N-terminal domain-containing protein [Paenibacillus sp.]